MRKLETVSFRGHGLKATGLPPTACTPGVMLENANEKVYAREAWVVFVLVLLSIDG